MTRNEKGFTLIELMIVIAIIAIIAAIAIPNLLAARLSANETAAIATLRNITSAQAQFQQSGKADNDDDGTGEYGGFTELSGAVSARLGGVALVPAVLSGAFRLLDPVTAHISRSGYFFHMFMPSAGGLGAGIPEPVGGFAVGDVDDNLGETTWCCYAWPVGYNQSGNRTFFTNQAGDVLGTEFNGYSLAAGIPASDAAYLVGGTITGNVAIGANGSDGQLWKQVN